MATNMDPVGASPDKLEYSEFLNAVRENKVAAVQVTVRELVGIYHDSQYTKEQLPTRADFSVVIPSLDTFNRDMAIITSQLKPELTVEEVSTADYPFDYQENLPREATFLEMMLPYILLIGVLGLFYYFMMQQQGGGNKVMNFGKSRARMQTEGQNKVTF
jgi:cell division protease FtsH